MPPSRDSSYLDPYRSAIKQHGPGFAATLWGSRSAQQLRFDVMIDLAGFKNCTIIDAGCGNGDFAARLLQRDIAYRKYIGIDAISEMITQANERELDRCTFLEADMVHDADVFNGYEADYVCFSGSLNTMDDELAMRLVRRAFDAAAQGVMFNFLSNRPHARWGDKDLTPARRFDTAQWLDWSMQQTSRVSFTQAYLDGHDATVMMLRDGDE